MKIPIHKGWVLPKRPVQNYEYYIFVAQAPDSTPEENVWLAYSPDYEIMTEGVGMDDAYDMAQDAVSLMIDETPAWKRPVPMLAYDAIKKVDKGNVFPGVDLSKVEFKAVKMIVPYKMP